MIPQTLLSEYREDGRFLPTYDAPLLPATAITASGTGDTYEMGAAHTLRLTRTVSVLAGGASVLVYVQTSADGSTWRDVGGFAPATTTGSDALAFAGLDRYARIRYALTGASATLAVTGTAVGTL